MKIEFCDYCLKVTRDYCLKVTHDYCKYCKYIIIDTVDSFKKDNSGPCFESIWLKIKCCSVSQLHILYIYYMITYY